MKQLREIADRYYSEARGLDQGIDDRLETRDLLAFIVVKLMRRGGGVLRGYPGSYIAGSARLKGKHHLAMGRGVVLGAGVHIDAVSTEGIRLGSRVTVDEGAILRASGVVRNLGIGIEVGNQTAIGAFNFIHGGGGVRVGEDCLLGPYVSIFSEDHRSDDLHVPIREQGEIRRGVCIGDDVWIGAGSVLLSGVTIGSHTIVAAGSVVTRDLEENAVYAGNPARRIKGRAEM
jgi:acetyltransferase-like isoleucine patch superfamily enzyme